MSKRVPKTLLDCDYCSEVFCLQINLLAHQYTHITKGHRPKNASRPNDFNLKSAPPPIESHLFECNICHKKYQSKKGLSSHTKIHKSTSGRFRKPFVCDVCGLKFAQKSDADEHQFVHWNEKRWDCSQCKRQFGLESFLRCHERTHRWIDSQVLQSSETIEEADFDLMSIMDINDAGECASTEAGNADSGFVSLTAKNHTTFADDNHYALEPILIDLSSEEAPEAAKSQSTCGIESQSSHADSVMPLCTRTSDANPPSHGSMLIEHQTGFDDDFGRPVQQNASRVLRNMLKTNVRNELTARVNTSSEQVSRVNISTNKKPKRMEYFCNLCKKWIKGQLYHFERHMITHTNRKPYACRQCGVRFNRKDNRNDHERRNACK